MYRLPPLPPTPPASDEQMDGGVGGLWQWNGGFGARVSGGLWHPVAACGGLLQRNDGPTNKITCIHGFMNQERMQQSRMDSGIYGISGGSYLLEAVRSEG